ncbi:Vacuolar calcium ion transporter [Fulvia fulva]|nr:Vacuolar calcium ion transporter [Fulvia fulva]KAK4620513.1 Vacuolar calcium ion transporter [Fulvia fulva]WPV16893.1 Vacuolar calcium ion transporter [Fulvia fulva]WPV32327.1 Vacuolar calcium ion transporter [Fulvia fulva]
MYRYRTEAIRTASQRDIPTVESNGGILPTHNTANKAKSTEAGGLSNDNGRGGLPSRPSGLRASQSNGGTYGGDGARDIGGDAEKSAHNTAEDSTSQSAPPPAPPPIKSEVAGPGDATIESTEGNKNKPPITTRMKNGCKRFGSHFKNAICHSWVNVLLIAVPAGIAAEAAHLSPAAIFAINAVAIVPLAGLLSHATESVASRLGDTLGALLNVSFGNAVELIIFIIALVKNEIHIVQASLLGSILANLLLILGMAFLFGGLRFREQIYNSTVTQMSACLLSLSVMSLLLPTAFHASFNDQNLNLANASTLKVSRGTSVILLLVYVLYLLFQLKSHAYMYESTPQAVIDEESHPGVLHDMMNSSSSSSDSSSSDSSDSDTSGSGSVTTRKKVTRMIKHRMRRKSSVSTSSSRTHSKATSALSSPTTQERQEYIEDPALDNGATRRESTLAAIDSVEDADADREDNGPTTQIPTESITGQPKVGFADDVEVVPAQTPTNQSARLAFNMRGLSSRVRPALPSMLSNNVFVQPRPTPSPAAQRPNFTRPVSAGAANLRRTSSLPERLNRETTPTPGTNYVRTDPLPPYQHQQYRVRAGNQPAPTKEEEEIGEPDMSKTAAVVLLLCSTALVAVCAEFMVDAIPEMIAGNGAVGEAFIGLIILPIVGNAAEHVTAVTVAAKNKMDLAIGVAVGSSIQIALFVTPVVVLLGWILDTNMSLYFNIFETISLFVTVFVVNFLVLDGRSNYLEGSLLIAAYVIIALVAFFYPESDASSAIGDGIGGT